LYLHDAIQKLDNLVHATIRNEGVHPTHRLISEKQPEFVQLSDLNKLRLLYFSQIMDEVCRISRCIRVCRGM
jgi:hypothetical protein